MGLLDFLVSYDWKSFFIEYKTVIIFYALVILLIFLNRKRFEFESKFIAIYRTKIGLKLMDKLGTKYREFFRIVGYIGIGAGFLGLLFISIFMLKQLYDIIFNYMPGTGVALLIPGVRLPGAPVFVPLWYGIITIFVIATVHEFSHGVLARVYNLKVKASGIVFFGPIIGAFVEPDEKKLLKKDDVCQYSVFAAGPFSNLILAGIVFLVWILLLPPHAPIIGNTNGLFHSSPLYDNFIYANGIVFNDINDSLPVGKAGIKNGSLITEFDGKPIKTYDEFLFYFMKKSPGDKISLKANGTVYTVNSLKNPSDERYAYIGTGTITSSYVFNKGIEGTWKQFVYNFILWFEGLFFWIWALSLAIGLINLLPLGPVDGGRIFQVAMQKLMGDKKKGDKAWKVIGFFYLAVLIITLILSYARNLFHF